jgi:Flp pilus assembly pilin Flp
MSAKGGDDMSKTVNEIDTESGQTMAEYTVVLGVITISIVTTLSLMSGWINGAFTRTLDIIRTVM